MPLGCCIATRGNLQNAIPIAAVWELTHLIMRVMDDLQDKDRSDALWKRIGEAQAYNFCCMLYVQCIKILNKKFKVASNKNKILSEFINMSQTLLEGQETDLLKPTRDYDSYWTKIEKKNAIAFSWGCSAAAQAGSVNNEFIVAMEKFGYHLGIILQLFDDYQGIWAPNGIGDLKMGKYTLPLIFGLVSDSVYKEKLNFLAQNSNKIQQNDSEIKKMLDEIGAKDFVIWAAMQERERASNYLHKLPQTKGKEFLLSFLQKIFHMVKT